MNDMTNDAFLGAVNAPEMGQDLHKTKLAGLVKAWEMKQGKNARRAGAFGLMAVTLSACGGSESGDSDSTPTTPTAPVDQAFLLTIETDNVEGGDGNDSIQGPLQSQGTFSGLVDVQTLTQSDVIDGGAGVDTLDVVVNGTYGGGQLTPTISNVEIYEITSRGFTVLDLTDSTGYEQLWNIDSDSSLVITDIHDAAVIGMDGVEAGTRYTLNFRSSADTEELSVVASEVGDSLLSGQAALNITVVNDLTTLNLDVSDVVRLDLEGAAADIEVLNITGSDLLQLTTDASTVHGRHDSAFPMLKTLDATGYTDQLALDISGSDDLESVMTGVGNDIIRIDSDPVDGGLSVDLGAGFDILEVMTDNGDFTGLEVTALDFTGGVTGVENLAFGEGVSGATATLDLAGVSADLETIWFFDGASIDDLDVVNSPVADLHIVAEDLIENPANAGLSPDFWADDVYGPNDNGGPDYDVAPFIYIDDLSFDASVVNLTVTTEGDLDIDGLDAPALETVTLEQNLGEDVGAYAIDFDVESNAAHDLSALQSITATAAGDATVDLWAGVAGESDMDALTTVTVTAAQDAMLEMDGVAGVQQEQEFSVSNLSFGTELILDIPGYGLVSGTGNAAFDLVANLDAALAAAGYSASFVGSPTDGTMTVVKDEPGPADPITINEVNGVAALEISNDGISVPGIEATGFEGLETVTVDAGVDADVDLTDVYGDFALDVTAGDDASVYLDNTDVVTLNVAVVDHANIDILSGDGFHGNPLLETLTVSGATTDIDLADDLSSMTTIDLTGVTYQFVVDATLAEFDTPTSADSVTYLIGGTQALDVNDDLVLAHYSVIEANSDRGNLGAEDARETFKFTDPDFGTVVIDDFYAGADMDNDYSDRIDLSELGYTGNSSELAVEVGDFNAATGAFVADNNGDDVRITDLTGGSTDFDGEIIVTDVIGPMSGTVDTGNDLSNNNII